MILRKSRSVTYSSRNIVLTTRPSSLNTRQPPLMMKLKEVVHLIAQIMAREETPQVVTLDSFGALCFLCREGN